MIIVIADVDEVAALLGVTVQRDPEIVRPQTSGPCVHCEDGTPYRCTYPYDDGRCPHLDNPEILCPVKDACSAMSEVARMRDVCEAEQEEQDADMAAQDAVYETETPAIADPGRLHTYVVEPEPEFPEPVPEEESVYEASPLGGEMRLDARGWTPEEERAMCGATTPAEAVALYRAAYPGSSRTDAAIKSRYHQKIRPRRHGADGPLPDFAGDTVPVTQCEEPASKGLYGDARALHADMMDGMMCDRPLTPEPETPPETQERESTHHPWIGMHVRVLDPHGGGVLLDVGGDPYLVRSFHLKALLLRDIDRAAILRRYPGRHGGFVDVETGSFLLRSRSGRGLKFWTPNGTFVMSRDEMIAVAREKSDAATISRIVTDAEQLSDATSKQTALGAF